jgi:Spy/CpxP family protein refolding chaperone
MNKLSSFSRAAFLAVALTTASTAAAFAQTTTPPSTTPPTCSGGGWHHHHFGAFLTEAERAQLQKDRAAAFAANPSLQTQATSLKQQFETLKGGTATPAQWQALHQQREAFITQLHAAETQIDPSVAPLLSKLGAAHGHWHHGAQGSVTQ